MSMFNLHGKIALVTGARRGMGRADALALARQGASVVVTDINQTECDAVAAEITASGGTAVAYTLDVSQGADVTRVFDSVIAQFGRLDILINNAGIFSPAMSLDMTEAEWDKTIAVNLKGQFLCAQRAAREMKKHGWGRIVNIASVASGQSGLGVAGGVHYTASKGGIAGMTEALAIELAPYGITVNVIGPGMIDTPMVSEARMPQSALDAMLAQVPMKRMGTPEEIAAAVVFLASEEASYVTGAMLFVDGGWLAA